MKNLRQLLIATTLFVASLTQAQTADEIINKYHEAIGGKEKLNKITSTTTEMSLNYGGQELPVFNYLDKEGRILTKVSFGGQEMIVMSYDGNKAFGFNQLTMKAEEMPAEMQENIKQMKLDFPDAFLNYKEKGFKAEYIGKETKEGTECHKVKLTKLDMMVEGKKVPNVVFYYFDAQDNVPVMIETEVQGGPNKGQMAPSKMGEYTEVDGLMFPFSVDTDNGPAKIKSMKLNTKIDEKLFVKK
jgi:hypothetical protein